MDKNLKTEKENLFNNEIFNNMKANNPHYKDLARKLRDNGYKVVHFLRFLDGYALQCSHDMRAVAAICEPSASEIWVLEECKLEEYIPKLVRADYRVIIG